MKFTFKKVIYTGKWKSFQAETHEIKVNKIQVGSIYKVKNVGFSSEDEGKFKIILQVNKKDIMEDNNPNCTWKNITLVGRFNTAQEAKEFLNRNVNKITEKYDLHIEEK